MAAWAGQQEDAWKFCASAIERHFEEQLKRWNAELDMLLVFAGLFSTALTAFLVQSYPLLQPDNTDTMVLALARISNQLHGFSVSSGFVNSTERAVFSPDLASFTAPGYAVWVNGLWFSSLVCTLSASSIAVMVKQWLHQYSQSLSGTSPDVASLRQYRYDSLRKWRVPEIIAALPILLQVALALFLAGLVVLLWQLHPSIAITATILSGLLIAFVLATTLLPILYADCCYQSPQALIFFLLAQALAHFTAGGLRIIEHRAQEAAVEVSSWTSRKYIVLARTRDAARRALKHLGAWGSFHSWHSREKPDAEARHDELEQSLALTAYYITLDTSMLNTTVIPCLSGMDELSARMSVRYGNLLRDVTARLPSREGKVWRPLMPFVLVVLSLITREPSKGLVRRVLLAMPRSGQQSAAKTKLGMLYLLAMSQLVSRRISTREAFLNLLVYLQDARIDSERSIEPAMAVLPDVEAVFPRKHDDLEALVDLDKFESVSYYFTGVEYIIKYLLRHRTKLEQDGSPVPNRIEAMLTSFGFFLCSPAWKTQKSRQGVVLWALRYSQLPPLIKQMTVKKQIPDTLGEGLLHALKAAVVVLERGYLGPSSGAVEQVATRGARLALSLIKGAMEDTEPSQCVAAEAITTPPSRDSTASETQESTLVEVSESLAMTEQLTIKGSPTARKLHVTLPEIHITPPSIDSSCQDDDRVEAATPWLESLLDFVDPEFAFMDDEEPFPVDHAEEDVQDIPLPDPEILRWRTGAPTNPKRRRRSNSSGSFTATGQHIIRVRAAKSPSNAPSASRKQSRD
ncbi:hypothetical protein GSI_03597 [Ganoderma sinense ZZ0214-1]|uniref:DUF6535 domain-containing protein n=1 Tax=Ganoderma sinense ZZ0214-1 TaxID=1077348 RepID=A0A2G8SJF5_9APHY|nr:hypothetical protein GSI_03597 [Ganoderma sinense ZZ0214-1]